MRATQRYPIDEERAVQLLADFIRLETINPPGNEKIGAEFLARHLEAFGLSPQITDLGEGRANVSAVLKGSGEAPALIYNGHIDVVPVGDASWSAPPFAGEIREGKMYGRGSSDMKGGVAAMLMAIGTLAQMGVSLRGDLVFSAVADEEVRGAGAQRFVDDGGVEGAGAVVISEPTNFEVYIAEKGTFWIELRTQGRTAHGAMPHLGVNAIVHMHALLS
ncbi:MAG: M20 family peptidase, partial [Nitrospinota bacterium]